MVKSASGRTVRAPGSPASSTASSRRTSIRSSSYASAASPTAYDADFGNVAPLAVLPLPAFESSETVPVTTTRSSPTTPPDGRGPPTLRKITSGTTATSDYTMNTANTHQPIRSPTYLSTADAGQVPKREVLSPQPSIIYHPLVSACEPIEIGSSSSVIDEKPERKAVKRRRISTESRAGIVFPAGRARAILKRVGRVKRVSKTASIMLASAAEYMCSEVLDLAVDINVRALKKKRLNPHAIMLAMNSDTDMVEFAGLQTTYISGTGNKFLSGWLPKIAQLIGTKTVVHATSSNERS